MKNPYRIREIRILPMDKKEEFKTEEDARKFLSTELVLRDGKYYYRERGIIIENEYALILFQYDASIIGYAMLNSIEKDVCTDIINGKVIQYNGYYQFFTLTIHNIANITLNEIQKIDKDVTRFSNSKWHIDIEHYNQVYDLLLKKQVEFEQPSPAAAGMLDTALRRGQ